MPSRQPPRRIGMPEERGAAVVELALCAMGLVLFMMLVVYAGRISEAEDNVRRAASEAARAASLRQHPADAVEAARSTVDANLSQAGVPCGQLDTDVDTGDFRAGGSVTVTVTCDAPMSDLALLGVPGTRSFRATEIEILDRLRSGP